MTAASRSVRADSGRLAAVVLATMLLAGCTGVSDTGDADLPSAAPTLSPGEQVVPTAAPSLRPDGSADQNLAYFTAVMRAFQDEHGRGDSTAQVVSALTAAGFDRDDIEATPGTTPAGYRATSIDVAVRFGGDCDLGSLLDHGVTTVVMPVLPVGTCLVGDQSQG